jgi:glucosylceramidase
MKKSIKWVFVALLALVSANMVAGCKNSNRIDEIKPNSGDTIKISGNSDVAFWLTNADKTVLFQQQKNSPLNFTSTPNGYPIIDVDTTQTFQTIDGFGFALTGVSAMLINSLPEPAKEALLRDLFLTDSTHIGVSYLRLSLGASDLSAAPFTYDEIPAGQTDTTLQHFSIDQERTDLIPILQKIIALNPSIQIIATPWTAPTWMKTNGSFVGGSLKPQYYDVYARYFVKYLQAMQAAGIHITAVTPQNEPLNAYNNPAMLMQSNEEDAFVKNYLGPYFQANHIDTKIIIYDHNLDHPEYATAILSDPAASPYIDGSAFHLYAGNINTMSSVHSMFPNKNLYFTEQATFSNGSFHQDLDWHIQNLIIGAIRNWSKNVLEWNLASDPNQALHTNGGCSTCLGALTIGTSVTRNVSYYIIAHAAKFVRPGSVRIASSEPDNLPNVAFKTPAGNKVLIVLNTGFSATTFNIRFNGKVVTPTLQSGAVGTFIWQ